MNVPRVANILVWWILTTFLIGSLAAFIPLVLVYSYPAYYFSGDNTVFPLLWWAGSLVVIFGPVMGFAQGLIIRGWLSRQKWFLWPAMSIVAVICAICAFVIFNRALPALAVVLVGATFGAIQTLALRHYVYDSGRWVLSNSIASGLSGAVIWLIRNASPYGKSPFFSQEASIAWAIGWIGAMLIFGFVTGLTFLWLQRKS